jgi:hypothetical protein
MEKNLADAVEKVADGRLIHLKDFDQRRSQKEIK